jgi:phosphate:Na+ symporter
MDTKSLIHLAGGLGMFLLGIHHLTEGLKGMAGNTLRRALNTLVSGKWSGIFSGAVFTAVIQSSSAATLAVIGFVSAGLVTFPQAVAVILGANLGTTATSWLVAVFGFKLKITALALPMLGLGAFLWLLAKGRVQACGAVFAGFGLVFTGIDFLQDGMAGIEWNLAGMGEGTGALWLLAGIGLVMTVAMQSSSAAAATTLVALAAGTVTLDQAFALIIGQNIGTTVTVAIAAVGGGMAVKRTALAHILFNVITGVPGMLCLGWLGDASRWLGGLMHDDNGVLTLAIFNTLFKSAGVLLFVPWLGAFARGIEWMTGRGRISAVARLDATLLRAGGPVALEAAWRALAELAAVAFRGLESHFNGNRKPSPELHSGIQQVRIFVEQLRFEGMDPQAFAERRVRIWHALDHLSRLAEDLAEAVPRGGLGGMEEEIRMAVGALDAWLTEGGTTKVAELEKSSIAFAAARKKRRERLLEDIALGRLEPPEATAALENIRWTDGALYHAWRLANSLEASSFDRRGAE